MDLKPGAKIKWKLTWHCCICCNPAKGRVEFEDGWLIKSSFLTKDEMIYFLLIFVFIRECCVTLIFFNGLSIHLSRISCKYLFLKSRHFLLIDHQMRTPSSLYVSKYLHDYSIKNPPLQSNFLSILHSFHRCAVIGNLGGGGEGPWGLGVLRVAKKSRVGQLFSCCSNLMYPRHHGPSPPCGANYVDDSRKQNHL